MNRNAAGGTSHLCSSHGYVLVVLVPREPRQCAVPQDRLHLNEKYSTSVRNRL